MDPNEIKALKEYIDPERVRKGLRVAHEIKDANKALDMNIWLRRRNDNLCGTAACLMGWMSLDKECQDIGLVAHYGNIPYLIVDHDGIDCHYHPEMFWIKPEKVDDFSGCYGYTRQYVNNAIADIIYSDQYMGVTYNKETGYRDVTIDDVISRLETLLAKVS